MKVSVTDLRRSWGEVMIGAMWDPAVYRRYGDERSRPFFELVGRIDASAPRAVVDLGCGPGDLTATLAQRWPDARVRGVDSSPEMIAEARAGGGPVEYAVGDVRDWSPDADVDVVVTNATMQWVPGQEQLLTRWVAGLPAGAWLALQVPGNTHAPSHQALREVAAAGPWRDRLGEGVGPRDVPDAAGYAELLGGAGCAVDAWETTYVHVLVLGGSRVRGGNPHPVLSWMEGTALRPVRTALADDEWDAFRSELDGRLAEAYPVTDGVVYFPFRRVFAVARVPG
jgi:trans-aconitate 2-methyltransferase